MQKYISLPKIASSSKFTIVKPALPNTSCVRKEFRPCAIGVAFTEPPDHVMTSPCKNTIRTKTNSVITSPRGERLLVAAVYEGRRIAPGRPAILS